MTYELLRPADLGRTFEAVFEQCRDAGYRGINITYPYKERVVQYLAAGDPAVQMMGACNTVLFEPSGPQGFNTDHSGLVAAYRNRFGDASPGRVALAGAGGVGRAIGFALAGLGASELRLFDLDRQKSVALADAIGPTYEPHSHPNSHDDRRSRRWRRRPRQCDAGRHGRHRRLPVSR